MADRYSPEERSRLMSRVRNRNTTPEIAVRRLLHRLGYRFRLHPKNLPGSPDIVLPKHRAAVFVHGCFWHRHEGCKHASFPKTRVEFWRNKFNANVARDAQTVKALEGRGWRVLIVWECQVRPDLELQGILARFLSSPASTSTDAAGQ